jgi:hypothetical protein
VIGLGRSDPSAYKYIAAIHRRLPVQERVKHVLHATGTSLEGETADIQALAGELHAAPFELRPAADLPLSTSSASGARQGTDARRQDRIALNPLRARSEALDPRGVAKAQASVHFLDASHRRMRPALRS